MRRPSFKGWITREVKYLSGEETINLRRLTYLAQGSKPRLRERLVLYVIATGQTKRFRSYLYDEKYIAEVTAIEQALRKANFEDMSAKQQAKLPMRYQKALESFRAKYHRIETRNESKRLRWERSVRLQKEKGLSNADIYQALKLNPGNINAYLKNGDIDRVTLATATDIMKYLLAAPN